jgi:arginine decarboxylase
MEALGPVDSSVSTSLSITVVGAVGRGPTTLAAFDAALVACGVANFNLVRLSSVIPPATAVTTLDRDNTIDLTDRRGVGGSGGWGDRLYAVWAFQSAERLGEEAWAGVAWVQDPEDGRGLFVEHEGHSESTVRKELDASLTSICRSRSMEHLPHRSVVTGVRCEGEPVGALVIAPYLSEPWSALS